MVGGRSIAFRDTVRMEAPVKSLDDLGGYCLADADNYGRQVDEEMMGREESKGFCKTIVDELIRTPTCPGKVISIYGLGGQGKTYMLTGLYQVLVRRGDKRVTALFHSFEGDAVGSMDSILKDLADLFECHGVPCPGFWMTYYAYRARVTNINKASREFIDDYERRKKDGVRDAFVSLVDFAAPFIDYILSAANPEFAGLPAGSMGSAIVERVSSTIDDVLRARAEKKWREVVSQEIDSAHLLSNLVLRLKEDIEDWAGDHPNSKIVVFLDTFEKLGWANGEFRGRYEWIKTLSYAHGTLWIVAGRMRVPWGNVLQYPIHLVEMTHQEADNLLVDGGIADSETRAAIEAMTGRLPIYLSLCVDLLKKDPSLSPGDLRHIGRENLPAVYLRNLDPDARNCAYVAAFLEYWSDDLIEYAIEGIASPSGIDVLERASFVRDRGDRREMHEIVADILRQSPDIDRLKKRLYRRMTISVNEIDSDVTLPETERRKEVLHTLRALTLLIMSGLKGVSDEESFGMRMRYAEAIWRIGNIESSLAEFRAIASSYGSPDNPTKEYLRATLKTAALETQRYLASGDVSYHMRAIEMTEEVLRLVRHRYPENAKLMWAVLNDLGVSWGRLKEFEKALTYQGEIAKELFARKSSTYDLDEARYMSNYGSTCHQYADNSGSDEKRAELYSKALDAYNRALDARTRIRGASSSEALITLTNIGVVQWRTGNLDEGKSLLREAIKRYENAGFPQSYPGYVRCWYQLANIGEARGKNAEERGDSRGAIRYYEEARSAHEKVYRIRVETNSALSVDAKKSEESIERCVEAIKRAACVADGR